MAMMGRTPAKVTPLEEGKAHADLPEADGLDDGGDAAGEEVGW